MLLKSGASVDMGEVVIFQLKIPLVDSLSHEAEHRLVMTVELVHSDEKNARVLDSFETKLPVEGGINEYL